MKDSNTQRTRFKAKKHFEVEYKYGRRNQELLDVQDSRVQPDHKSSSGGLSVYLQTLQHTAGGNQRYE